MAEANRPANLPCWSTPAQASSCAKSRPARLFFGAWSGIMWHRHSCLCLRPSHFPFGHRQECLCHTSQCPFRPMLNVYTPGITIEVLFTGVYLPKIQSICEIAFLALPANFPLGWASRYFL